MNFENNDLSENHKVLEAHYETLETLERYFRESAITQQVLLPRWATW
ncbi:MAG: hypothetical protein JNK42_03690 [Caedimonas sp.]|nr:hypothetical protein [Caedimonas sp.]